MTGLDGKKILVFGATGGLGEVCVQQLVNLGATVIAVARSEEKIAKLRESCSGQLHSIIADITDVASLPSLLDGIKRDFEKLDGFLYAAGAELTKPIRMTSHEDFLEMFSINALVGFDTIRFLVSRGGLKSGASLVLISSIMGKTVAPGLAAYCASKGAVEQFVKVAALELAAQKVRINSVCPGMVRTPMFENYLQSIPEEMRLNKESQHPLGLGFPEDVAHLCCFLLSDQARWITGTAVVIDGGYSLS
jgi:NAD(P)-dependent dehydrogenase (short-subunit alcohol dehydrogenase family)